MPNFYKALGVSARAEPGQVKAAFHKLAKSSHPDVNSGDANAERRFKEISQAYEVLSHADRRAAYDLGLEHKHAETRRRVKTAMSATAASFTLTVGCGLFFALSDFASPSGGHQPIRLIPPSQQDILRQRAELLADPAAQPVPNILHSRPKGASREAREAQGERAPSNQNAAPREPSPPQPKRAAAATEDGREKTLGESIGSAPLPGEDAAQTERALRLHIKGMEQIARGNVSAARKFFALAAKAGLARSMRALAGTYDPVQLNNLKVLGTQPDVDAARKWYEQASDRDTMAKENAGAQEVAAAPRPAADLARFRAAYTAGDGLAYVVIKEENDEHIYRFGDASRLAAKRDRQSYTLFTCDTPHVFTLHNAEDNAALLKAIVVTPGDVRFAELDGKYLSSCNYPPVKSAIPKG
jgi:curved DNA-binding protein CbpA